MDRPKLVLLPGMDGTGVLFRPLLDQLGAAFPTQVVAYPRDRILSYEQLESFVRSQLPEGEAYVLVAESFSGPVAIRLAASGCGQALVLCASFAAPPVPAQLHALRFLLRSWLFRVPVPQWLHSVLLLGPHCPEDLLRSTHSVIRSVDASVMAGRVREVLSVDVQEALRSIQVPILYLAPSGDRLLGARTHRSIKSLNPAAEVVSLDGPHLLLQRRPAEAAQCIRAFLAEHG